MTIDLTPLLRGEIREIAVDSEFIPDGAPEGITILPGSRITGKISDSGGYIRLVSKVKVPYSGECARCLDEVKGTLEFDFDRTLVTEGMIPQERLEEEAEEYLLIRSGMLNPDEALSESVFLEFPMLLLCSADCPGLCPKCGRKLGPDGVCNCAPKEIDPRMAKLKELFPD